MQLFSSTTSRRNFGLSALRLMILPATFSNGMSTAATPQQCAVIGCGVLGTSLCKQLLSSPDFEGWTVTGITKTTNNHESIQEKVGNSDRFSVSTMDDCKGKTYDNVVFCAPPSGFEDYGGAVEDAITNVWSGLEKGGTFVFTSSGGIHGPGVSTTEPETITEETPTASVESSPRTARLIKAEEACRQHGGCCVRLAGLYTLERGAHSFWLNSGKDVMGRADGLINLLHYDDAAGAALAALKVGSKVVKGRNFLVSDSNPITRQQICESALKAKLFQDKTMPKFLGKDTDPIGKLYDGTVSERDLKWKPRYPSFDEFMTSH